MTHWVIEEQHPHGHSSIASRAFDTREEARWRLGEIAAEPSPDSPDAHLFRVTRRAADFAAYDKAPCGHGKSCGIVYRIVKF